MTSRTLSGALILVLAACSGDENGPTTTETDTGTTTGGASAVFFLSEVDVGRVSGDIDGATVRAHRSMEFFNAAFGVLISDPNVRSRLTADDDTAPACAGRYLSPPRSEFTIDFTGCSAVDMSGGVFVKDHPVGLSSSSFKPLRSLAAPCPGPSDSTRSRATRCGVCTTPTP